MVTSSFVPVVLFGLDGKKTIKRDESGRLYMKLNNQDLK